MKCLKMFIFVFYFLLFLALVLALWLDILILESYLRNNISIKRKKLKQNIYMNQYQCDQAWAGDQVKEGGSHCLHRLKQF